MTLLYNLIIKYIYLYIYIYLVNAVYIGMYLFLKTTLVSEYRVLSASYLY